MVWTRSGWHGSWFFYGLATSASTHTLLGHQLRAALYNNTRTPGFSTSAAGYGRNEWSAGEAASAPGWPAGGRDVPNLILRAAAGSERITIEADPVFSASPVTLDGTSLPYGSMIYDTQATGSQSLQSFLAHYFGGPVPARNGTFEILWGPDGLAVAGVPLTARVP